VRRQSEAATALWIIHWKLDRVPIQSAVAASLCRRTPKLSLNLLRLFSPHLLGPSPRFFE